MTIYDQEAASFPASHFIRNTSRRIRRWHKGSTKRLIVVILGWLFVAYLGLCLVRYAMSSGPLLSCDSSRARLSRSIHLPDAPDTRVLTSTWMSLQNAFDQNKPQPLDLKLTTFKSLSQFPSLDDIQTHTELSKVDARASRNSHVQVVRALPAYPESLYSGRGIVMLAGGKYSCMAATGLGMLREIGSTLPVEVWMKDEQDEKAGWCREIVQDGMVCRLLSDYMDVSKLEHGYQLKINSILFSTFQQILFLDADNVPVRNPDGIFESSNFKDTGIILWPDYWKHTGSPLLPFEVGLSEHASEMLREDQTAESGQLVWDKKRHWKALCLAAYYNYYGPQHYYTMISQGWAGWGDKDTFPIALRSLHEDYYMVPHPLRTLFVNGTTQGVGMLQADPINNEQYVPMFLHANIIKWSIRDFLCVGCPSDSGDPKDPVAVSFFEKPEYPINKHLKQHHRIFNLEAMQALGIDPEPLIWKSMEHAACRSVWQETELCARTRAHMTLVFGHEFRPAGTMARLLGYGDQVCIKEA